jgi:hypothetical protein
MTRLWISGICGVAGSFSISLSVPVYQVEDFNVICTYKQSKWKDQILLPYMLTVSLGRDGLCKSTSIKPILLFR